MVSKEGFNRKISKKFVGYKKVAIICLTILLISSVVFKSYFSYKFNSKINEGNEIIGGIKGNISFEGEWLIESHALSIRGMNWKVNITGLNKIIINNETEKMKDEPEEIILTENISIIPLNQNYYSTFYLWPWQDTDGINIVNGRYLLGDIKSSNFGYELSSLVSNIKDATITAVLHNRTELRVLYAQIITNNNVIKINREHSIIIEPYNEIVELHLNASNGSQIRIPFDNNFPSRMQLNGKLIINDFTGGISNYGRAFLTNQLIIKSKEIIINTIELPSSGAEGSWIWVGESFWYVKIDFKGKDFEVKGFILPYWIVGTIISFVPISLIYFMVNKNINKIRKTI